MATIRRIGFGTIFELENDVVGIGTDNPTHKLQALGNIRSEAATDIGISSLTTYQGFTDKEARFTTGQIDNQSQSGSTSGEIVIDGDVTVSSATTFTSGPQHLTITDTFTLPSGDTNSRELKPTAGSLRFNQDFATLEFYTGNNWATVNTFTDMKTNPQGRGRGVFFGGEQKGGTNQAGSNDFVNIMSLGNSLSFGDLSTGNRSRLETAGASSTRGIFGCGKTPSNTDIIDYITIASEGKAIDFGNAKQTNTIQNGGTKSSSTRGIFGGGTPTELQYVEISTLANSLDFGDLAQSNGKQGSSSSSPTRAVFLADSGHTGGTIEAVTISSTGSAVTFGKFIDSKSNAAGAGNSVRGVFAGAYKPGDTKISLIEYATMSSLGNTTEFGDLAVNRACHRSCSKNTRALFGGGYFTTTPTATGGTGDNRIEFVTIATTGNSTDFGDTTSGQHHARGASLSDSHGGLGGF